MEWLYRFSSMQKNLLSFILINIIIKPLQCTVVQLEQHNLNDILQKNELVMVNFYADWCRFSQILTPIFDEAAKKVKEEFPADGKVAMARVDCDKESGIASQYSISKYPTIKIFRSGQPVKKEYRGQRSPEAILEFMKEQLKEVIKEHNTLEELDNLDENKRNIIGYFDKKDSDEYRSFSKVASALRESCDFHVVMGEASAKERTSGDNVLYRPPKTHNQDLVFTSGLNVPEILKQWAEDKCVPLVREITFENAEELTEEGIPFLILFHHPDDKTTPELYNHLVMRDLLSEKNSITFLTADGIKFAHPLQHLGKSQADLPLIAIDSFRHMYLFPHNVKTDMEKPGLLKQFIADLHSNKLHREYHHGPDPTQPPVHATHEIDQPSEHQDNETPPPPRGTDGTQDETEYNTDPPESTFRKLAPSRNRYTLLRDEL